jgi:hypothetical protein
MFAPGQYRAKAAEYAELAKTANSFDNKRDFQKIERSFSVLADNEQWLADNHDHTVHAPPYGEDTYGEDNGVTLPAEEEHVLRCLGAAVMLQWNTLPKKLQRELFDTAGSMGELLETAALRGQVARFLHKHKDDGEEIADPFFTVGDGPPLRTPGMAQKQSQKQSMRRDPAR